MTDTARDLIQRMARELDLYRQMARDDCTSTHPFADEARAYLAQPEPEGPTDEELETMLYYEFTTSTGHGERSDPIGFARAVLARWGNHPAKPDTSLQPIPVSERLPEPEDCDGQGMCWWWHPSHRESDAPEGWMQRPREWGFVRVRYISDGALVCTHWLPAHVLPLPTHA